MAKKSKKKELKSTHIEVLKMIWKISRGTGYIYQMQLTDYLLYLKIFPNQNTVSKALSGLTSQGYLQKATYNNGRRILVMTHKGATVIGVDIKKKIEFTPTTLHENTVICKLLYDLMVKYKVCDFWALVSRLEYQHSSIFVKKSSNAAVDYYQQILSGKDRNAIGISRQWITNHMATMEKYSLQMLGNLSGSEIPSNNAYGSKDLGSILLLAKKNIYVFYITKRNVVIYIKILNYDYGREKIKSDLEYIGIYQAEIYPDYSYEFVIITSNYFQVESIREEMKNDSKLNSGAALLSVDFAEVEDFFKVRV